MSASISISNLSYAAPDGRTLFEGIDLSFANERAGLVGRNGVGKTTLIRLIAGERAPLAGSIAVTGSVALLRQAVQPDPSATIADLFGVRKALALLRRAEAGTATVEDLAEADWTLEDRIAAALARVGLDRPTGTALGALSGGEWTRARLAALTFAEPDFLLLDEPTNNLDRAGRAAVTEMLAAWRGGAIIVSHDRDLLDRMDAIVELTTLGAARYGGNFAHYRERKAVELAAARHDLAAAERRVADVEARTQLEAERKARRDSAGSRKAAKGDAPKILLGSRKSRSEVTSGDNALLAQRRSADAEADAAKARSRIEVLQPFSVVLPPTGLAAGKTVLELDRVTAGYHPGRPIVRDFSLLMVGPERVALTGSNGSGKTTILSVVSGRLTPFAGIARVFVPFALFDQDVSLLDRSVSIRDNFRRLNPETDENACRATLARFMFRADAALQIAGALSGGQLLRAGLACVLGGLHPPQLLILDEPTNHLDLDSIETIEAGLRAYDGALLVVSHDEAFLEAIGIARRVELEARAERNPAL
ncbi:MAG: ABC-F family ATP-binding cassette domain-containing protein [Bauldia sp.]